MERMESQAVFESLNLNPRLLINEVLNTVEYLLDDAFDYFHKEASTLLNTDGTDRSQHLTQESFDESLAIQDVLIDPDLDAQLDSLRDKLNLMEKENAEMNRELQALERQFNSSDSCAAPINEALQLYEQHSADNMFQEMVKTASELRTKVGNLKTRRIENLNSDAMKRICDPKRDVPTLNHCFSTLKSEDLQAFVIDLKKM
ncbi:protein MIS12 homolog isoform X2 [Mercurialis annua]|uniref:protein MIS12 homolog isoform X2 n=1 Tax=Mercurialis annua TaxID=3986 RepID=UPI00216010E8|nr:protein MIS12 homolog isoform X2 [Mercurialis annua]